MKSIWLRRALFAALGGGAGFAYYFFVGCVTGTCPITSNPYITTAYGALIGIVLVVGTGKETRR
jgi:hypothetical protein